MRPYGAFPPLCERQVPSEWVNRAHNHRRGLGGASPWLAPAPPVPSTPSDGVGANEEDGRVCVGGGRRAVREAYEASRRTLLPPRRSKDDKYDKTWGPRDQRYDGRKNHCLLMKSITKLHDESPVPWKNWFLSNHDSTTSSLLFLSTLIRKQLPHFRSLTTIFCRQWYAHFLLA